jgi:hypothetical protein
MVLAVPMSPPDEAAPRFGLEPHEDVIERTAPGEEPLWLWTQTCSVEDCPCRTALVVAAASRDRLDAQIDIVRGAWDEAEDDKAFNAVVPADLVAFEIEIDSGEVSMPLADTPEVSPAVGRAAQRIDGDLLDHLASQWHRGKEMADASTVSVQPSSIRDFKPGQLLAWDEVFVGARIDIYPSDGAHFEAIDTYCVRPKCECNQVHIQFYQLPERDLDAAAAWDDGNRDESDLDDDDAHVFVGTVSLKLEDPVAVDHQPNQGQGALLQKLFALHQQRYPNWVARLSDRADKMASFGEQLYAYLEQQRSRPWVSASRKRKGNRR